MRPMADVAVRRLSEEGVMPHRSFPLTFGADGLFMSGAGWVRIEFRCGPTAAVRDKSGRRRPLMRRR